MYLLDTNVVSELRKARPHGAVLAWIKGVPDRALFLSALRRNLFGKAYRLHSQRKADLA